MKRREFLSNLLQSLAAAYLLPAYARGASLMSPTDRESNGIVGDCGWSIEETTALRASLKKAGIRKLILPGDNIYDVRRSSYADVWDAWRKDGFDFPVVAIGNHNAGYGKECAYFGMPGEYYAKTDGPCLFLILNSDNEQTVDVQRDWLESRLASAHSPFLFVVFHHPPALITNQHGPKDKAKFKSAIRPVLMAYSSKINAVIVGHDHAAGLYDFGSIPLLLSGAGFEAIPTSALSGRADGIPFQTEWIYDGSPTWVRLDLDETGAQFTFIDVATSTAHVEKLTRSANLEANASEFFAVR